MAANRANWPVVLDVVAAGAAAAGVAATTGAPKVPALLNRDPLPDPRVTPRAGDWAKASVRGFGPGFGAGLQFGAGALMPQRPSRSVTNVLKRRYS